MGVASQVDVFGWGIAIVIFLSLGFSSGHAYARRKPVAFAVTLALQVACLYATVFMQDRWVTALCASPVLPMPIKGSLTEECWQLCGNTAAVMHPGVTYPCAEMLCKCCFMRSVRCLRIYCFMHNVMCIDLCGHCSMWAVSDADIAQCGCCSMWTLFNVDVAQCGCGHCSMWTLLNVDIAQCGCCSKWTICNVDMV